MREEAVGDASPAPDPHKPSTRRICHRFRTTPLSILIPRNPCPSCDLRTYATQPTHVSLARPCCRLIPPVRASRCRCLKSPKSPPDSTAVALATRRRRPGMERILGLYYERYRQCEKALPIKEPKSQEEWFHEYGELKRKFDALQSHVMGENLDTLSLIELQQVELQLESSLKHVRFQMNHQLLNSIAELQRKEKSLMENQVVLENKITENKNVTIMAQQMNAKEQSHDPTSSSAPPTVLSMNSFSTTLPSWMLRPPA